MRTVRDEEKDIAELLGEFRSKAKRANHFWDLKLLESTMEGLKYPEQPFLGYLSELKQDVHLIESKLHHLRDMREESYRKTGVIK